MSDVKDVDEVLSLNRIRRELTRAGFSALALPDSNGGLMTLTIRKRKRTPEEEFLKQILEAR